MHPGFMLHQYLGGFVIPAPVLVNRPKSGMSTRSARFLFLLGSILAFGMSTARAQERHVIIHHDVALHSCPDSKCRVVAQLPILSPVYVMHREEPAQPEDGEEIWTHANITERGRASGWVLDGNIGYPGRFRPVRNWNIREFSYCIGDYCPEFMFTVSGEFTTRYAPCFDGLCPDPPGKATCHRETEEKQMIDGSVYCASTGNLYRAGDAIRLGDAGSHEFVFFNRRGELCADMYTCEALDE